ncbi:MAG: helix-turn-helix domain-containing protein [Bacteroidales bacterium]|nr:helix-turn-helix domain-containing protein [Bacteroidales bacterium]
MQAVSEYRNNLLSLREVVTKYDISESAFYTWRKAYETNQLDLIGTRPKGRRPKDNMGRPKKKKPEEMTELERLRYENECLRTENALLKKVRALVEERNARLREIGQKPSKN